MTPKFFESDPDRNLYEPFLARQLPLSMSMRLPVQPQRSVLDSLLVRERSKGVDSMLKNFLRNQLTIQRVE